MRSRVCALVPLLTLLLAASAQATISMVSASDQDGPADSFFTNEILYATGVNNALAGGAQVCVVPAHVSSGTCRQDPAWGRPNAIAFHGTFPPQPIVAPLLPVGTYRILADNGDGDGDPDDVVSETFTVIPCDPGDGCSTDIAAATMSAWKQAAGESRTGMAAFCLGSSVTSVGGAVSAGSAVLGGDRDAIMAEIKGEGVSLQTSPRGSRSAAFALLRTVSCGAQLMYDDIVADPPDPDYKHLEEASPNMLDYTLAGDAHVVAAAQTLEAVRAYGVAHRIGVERYLGAREAGDAGWKAVLAQRAGDQALATQSHMRRLGDELRAAAVAVADPEVVAPTEEQVATARAIRDRIRISGFIAAERAQLVDMGLDDEEIDEARAQLGAPLPEDVAPMAPDAAMQLAADHIDNATCIDDGDLCGFDLLGREAAASGANGAVPPTISLSPLQIRESDHGVNHARVLVELSHPSADWVSGSLAIAASTTAEDEVGLPLNDWYLEPGRTRAYRSVTVVNDTEAEDDETAELTASASVPAGMEPVSAPVTVLDDDGPGDPPSRPRAERGLIALFNSGVGGREIHLTEPDATELTPLLDDPFLDDKWVPAWSPDGRWLLSQHVAPTASALAISGEPVYRHRVTGDGTIAGEPALLIEGKPYPAFPTFSRDGRRLLYSHFADGVYKLVVVPFDPATGAGGTPHVTGDDPPLEGWWSGHGASFNPAGSRIVFAGCAPGYVQCGLFVVPVDGDGVATGAPQHLQAGEANMLTSPSWSPDGKLISFFEYKDGQMGLRTLKVDADGQALAPTRWAWRGSPYSTIGLAAWAPDSKSVAFGIPTDPLLPDNQGGAALLLDLDGEGAAASVPRQLGLTRWVPHPLWSDLPDDAAPVTVLTASPAAGTDGVHRSPVTVSLRATDNRAVAELEYFVDGVRQTVAGAEASFTLDASGTYVVRFRARDARGNVEAEQQRTLHVEIPSPPAPSPAPVETPAPPAPASPAPAPPAVAAARLPSNRRCVSRRRFRIRLRQSKDDPLVRAQVYLGKRRMKTLSGRRLKAVVDLRGLPKGKFTVRVVGTLRSGARAVSRRTYRTCAPKRKRA